MEERTRDGGRNCHDGRRHHDGPQFSKCRPSTPNDEPSAALEWAKELQKASKNYINQTKREARKDLPSQQKNREICEKLKISNVS